MKNEIIIEPAVDDFLGVQTAIFKKAKRVELCSDLKDGGLLPDRDLAVILVSRKVIPVVMLRTNNTFQINDEEIKQLQQEIIKYRKIGVKEYIFGWIKDNEIDINACKAIIGKLKKGEKYVFHRAIDELGRYDKNIPILIELGFSRVLTGGGVGSAIDHLEILKSLVQTYNKKIKIVVGGKVTEHNLKKIEQETNANEFHGSHVLW